MRWIASVAIVTALGCGSRPSGLSREAATPAVRQDSSALLPEVAKVGFGGGAFGFGFQGPGTEITLTDPAAVRVVVQAMAQAYRTERMGGYHPSVTFYRHANDQKPFSKEVIIDLWDAIDRLPNPQAAWKALDEALWRRAVQRVKEVRGDVRRVRFYGYPDGGFFEVPREETSAVLNDLAALPKGLEDPSPRAFNRRMAFRVQLIGPKNRRDEFLVATPHPATSRASGTEGVLMANLRRWTRSPIEGHRAKKRSRAGGPRARHPSPR